MFSKALADTVSFSMRTKTLVVRHLKIECGTKACRVLVELISLFLTLMTSPKNDPAPSCLTANGVKKLNP